MGFSRGKFAGELSTPLDPFRYNRPLEGRWYLN
jgi:hypothetical protein